MKGIILAAGTGSRLKQLTADRPKCLLDLHGQTLISLQRDVLLECSVSTIAIITGYCAGAIERELGNSVDYFHYPDYAATNNLMTLGYAASLLEGDVVILFADVLIERESLRRCLDDPGDFSLLIDTSGCRPGTMRVRIERQRLLDIGSHIKPAEGHGNFVGIAKYSARGGRILRNEILRLFSDPRHRQSYYTAALPSLSTPQDPVGTVDIAGALWLEIDSCADYERALKHDFYRVLGSPAANAPRN